MSDIFSATVSLRKPVNGFVILKAAHRVSHIEPDLTPHVSCLGGGYLFRAVYTEREFPTIRVCAPGDNPIDTGNEYTSFLVMNEDSAAGYDAQWLQAFTTELCGELRTAHGVACDVDYDKILVAMHAM